MILMRLLLIFLLLTIFFHPSLAETTGNISSGGPIKNITSVTGLLGYTVLYCDADADCRGYKCFVDFDGEAVDSDTSQPSGWCNATSVSNCYNDGSATASGSKLCITNTTYRECASGSWGSATSCSSGQTCSAGACSGASTSTSGGGGGAAAPKFLLAIINVPLEVSVVQGKSYVVTADVRNDGNTLTQNVTLSVSGIAWASVVPGIYAVLSAGNSKQFNITIAVPADAEVKSYTVSLQAASTNTTANTSFALKVTPSPATASGINQTYLNYVSVLGELDANLTGLEKQGATQSDVDDIRNILNSARSKVRQANQSIAAGDYFTANSLLAEASSLLDEARNRLKNIGFGGPAADLTFVYLIIGIAVAVVAFIAYLFWPTREQKPYTQFRKTK